MSILAPFKPRINAGGVITAAVGIVGVPVHWELVSVDPDTGAEGVALGSLKFEMTISDGAGLTANAYYAPSDPGAVGAIERIRVRVGVA
jgi:hypothetical protein